MAEDDTGERDGADPGPGGPGRPDPAGRGGTRRAGRAAPGLDTAEEGRADIGYVVLETSDLLKLEELCSVLDISYSQKIKELGLKSGNKAKTRMRSKLLENIMSLQLEKDAIFSEARHQARSLMELWKQTHVPIKKAVLDTVFSLVDAESSEDIITPKFLRNSLEDDLKKEIERIQLAKDTELRTKFEAKRLELKNLLQSNHMVPSDINFDLDEEVADDELSQVTTKVKSKIRRAKKRILERKELVFRIEAINDAITNAWPYRTVKVLLAKANCEVEKLRATRADITYDGMDISDVLDDLELSACCILDAAAEASLRGASRTTDFRRSTTRSGAKFTSDVPVTDKILNANLDWNRVDRKRMLNVVYRVTDLNATVESYESDFGMKVLRKFGCPEKSCSFAIVGFGPESNSFTLKLAEDYEMRKFNIGDGFGNIGVICKVNEVCDRIRTSERCRITCRPANLKRDSPVIAAAQDWNGYHFELIEKAPLVHISHVMLRVNDLDKSIKFYEKALGMKLTKKKDLPEYECAIAQLRYGVAEDNACLELTSNYGVQKYSRGDGFIEVTIGSDNVDKSLEEVEKVIKELGGNVVQRPRRPVDGTAQPRPVASFKDPDGYDVVIVDNLDYDTQATAIVVDDTEANGSEDDVSGAST